MRRKGIRISFSLLFAMAGLLFFAGPVSASGESIGSCVVEKLEHIMEDGHHDGHADVDEDEEAAFKRAVAESLKMQEIGFQQRESDDDVHIMSEYEIC